MDEHGSSSRLDAATTQRLRALPLSERLRYLRTDRKLTQDELLERLSKLDGRAPRSKGWVSGIESGSLNLAPRWTAALGDALRLHDEDRWLLEPEPDGASLSPGLWGYAAWLAVRLAMADELIRTTKNAEGRARGRAVRRVLAETLQQDDDVRHASAGRIGSLDPFTDLPEVTRWMLVTEAAYSDPFLPYQPLDTRWGADRITMLEQLADELGLSAPEAGVALIDAARSASFTAWIKDHEPKAPGPDPSSVALTALMLSPASKPARILRGDALVGTMGWSTACGTFLSLSFTGPQPGDLPAACSAWLPDRHLDRDDPAGLDLAPFLLSLGDDALTRSLSMLTTLARLQAALDTSRSWCTTEAVPDMQSVQQWLVRANQAVESMQDDELNADSSSVARHRTTTAAIITRFLEQVRKSADLQP